MKDCDCEYCRRSSTVVDRTKDSIISLREFCKRAGDVSHMWPRRRMKDASYRFPVLVRLGRYRGLWESDAMMWLDSKHAEAPARKAA